MDDLISDFITETREYLNRADSDLLALAQTPGAAAPSTALLRHLHTIKGDCGFVKFARLQQLTHHAESLAVSFGADASAVTPARVGLLLEAIDRMRVIVSHAATHAGEPAGSDDDLIARLDAASAGYEISGTDMPEPARPPHTTLPRPRGQHGLQPIGRAWARLPYIVQNLNAELDKKIELVMHGGDIEIADNVLDLIKAPLTHMIRNSGDHGIETPAERLRAGKDETGTITLSAARQDDYVIMEVADDGQGLNLDLIRARALEQKLVSADKLAAMSTQDIQKLIFNAGFSTASQVSAVSGRGIGMDVVRANIEELGGSIELHSEPGKGSSFHIRIPVRLAGQAQVKS